MTINKTNNNIINRIIINIKDHIQIYNENNNNNNNNNDDNNNTDKLLTYFYFSFFVFCLILNLIF